MRNLLQRHPVAIVLAAFAIVLAAIVAIEAAVGFGEWKSATGSAAKTAPPAEAKLIPPMTVTQAEQAYPETANRPLFTPTRRPAPAAPVAGGSMAKGLFTLQGIIGVGDLQIAFLREKSNGRVHRIEKGKEVNGMTLTAVEPDKVTLSQGGDSETIALAVQKGPAVATAAPPATPAPPGAAAGPFAASPSAAPATLPGQPAQPPVPQAPVAIQPPAAPGAPPANPATRSGFGPFAPGTPQPTTSSTEQSGAAMTPEELLARRRARRQQMQGQQPQN